MALPPHIHAVVIPTARCGRDARREGRVNNTIFCRRTAGRPGGLDARTKLFATLSIDQPTKANAAEWFLSVGAILHLHETRSRILFVLERVG
eukprot:4176555-Prymnesium_polylepis.1